MNARMAGAVPAQRILVITLSNVGDLVMTTPVLEALRAHYPTATIDVVADRRSSVLLRALPQLGHVYHRDKRAGWRAQWQLLRALRQQTYQLAVDLRTDVMPYLLRAERRLPKPRRRAVGLHAVEAHFRALQPLLGNVAPPPCRVHLDQRARDAAAELLSDLPGWRWLAIAPGANWPGKRWPATRYRALLETQAQAFDGAIVVGGRNDLAAPLTFEGLALPVADLSDRTDLITAAAAIARASAFVGNDSGLGHIAAALNVPCLTVFGPGDAARYRPWGTCVEVVQAPHENLEELSVTNVASALEALLSAS